MPEGDTLFRTATVLREVLLGRVVTGARGRAGGPQLSRLVGSHIDRVDSVGKHLLIGFDDGLVLHTHLGMNGSWHRYRPGERWRRSPARAVCVIETPTSVAVCFDASVAELLETRALATHPVLGRLGPDLMAATPDVGLVLRRLAEPSRSATLVAEALLDQRVMAGLGNVYRSELLWEARVSPFAPLAMLPEPALRALVERGGELLRATRDTPHRVTTLDALGGPPGTDGPRRGMRRHSVYGRAGRPCPRCGTPIRTTLMGALPRRVWWCPTCQPDAGLAEAAT